MGGRLSRDVEVARDLPGDLFAGLTLWAVFAAQAIAYSRLAHATPVAGLVTAIAGAMIYALLGTSRRNSIGPAGGIAAIVGAAVATVPASPHLISRPALPGAGLRLALTKTKDPKQVQRIFDEY